MTTNTCDRSDHDHRSLDEARRCAAGRQLTVADIEAGYTDERWSGHGYLLERRFALNTAGIDPAEGTDVSALVPECDAIIIERANAQGWTSDDLFTWLNSKLGRWTADSYIRSGRETRWLDKYVVRVEDFRS